MNYATDAVGACFSLDTVKNDTGCFLPLSPQIENTQGNFLVDKSGWIKISGSYIAQGGERFLTIGNFKDYANTDIVAVSGGSADVNQTDWSGGYYYLDDICVSTDSAFTANYSTGILSYSQLGNDISVYPSPAINTITIDNFPKHSTFAILDLTGREIEKGELQEESTQINVSQLPDGIYFLVLNEHTFHKFIIVR